MAIAYTALIYYRWSPFGESMPIPSLSSLPIGTSWTDLHDTLTSLLSLLEVLKHGSDACHLTRFCRARKCYYDDDENVEVFESAKETKRIWTSLFTNSTGVLGELMRATPYDKMSTKQLYFAAIQCCEVAHFVENPTLTAMRELAEFERQNIQQRKMFRTTLRNEKVGEYVHQKVVDACMIVIAAQEEYFDIKMQVNDRPLLPVIKISWETKTNKTPTESSHSNVKDALKFGSMLCLSCVFDTKEVDCILESNPYGVTNRMNKWAYYVEAPTASGLKWNDIGTTRPDTGREIHNESLSLALRAKTAFSQEEWDTFSITYMYFEDFVKSSDKYFRPTQTHVHSKAFALLNPKLSRRASEAA